MRRYKVTLTPEEIEELEHLIQKGGKRVPDQTCTDLVETGPKRRAYGMELRTDYGSIPHVPKHDIRSRQTICHGGNGSCVRAEKAGKSQPKSDGRGRGTVVCDSVFRPAGGMQPLDEADDSGRTDAAGSGGLYNRQYGM